MNFEKIQAMKILNVIGKIVAISYASNVVDETGGVVSDKSQSRQ